MKVRLERGVRDTAEAFFYLELQPCPACGHHDRDIVEFKSDSRRTEWLTEDGTLAWETWERLDVPCTRCTNVRTIEYFEIPDQRRPWTYPEPTWELGGSMPSQIIGPHEFVGELLRIAAEIPIDQMQAMRDDWRRISRLAGRAMRCANELRKFFRDGCDEIDPEHFRDDAARAERAAHPDRYRRAFVEALATRYRELRVALEIEDRRRTRENAAPSDPEAQLAYFRKVGVPEHILLETMGPAGAVAMPALSPAALEAHRQWLAKAGGRRLEARDGDATGKELAGQELESAVFERIVLDRAAAPRVRFAKAELTEVRARVASFRDALFLGAKLRYCDFGASKLARARFVGAVVEDTSFRAAELDGTSWNRARVTRCSFADAVMVDALLDEARFTDCDFRGVSFAGADRAVGVELVRCDLRDTSWGSRRLVGLKLVDCRLAGARGTPSVSEAVIERPDLSPAGDGSQIVTEREVLAQWGIQGGPRPPARGERDHRLVQRIIDESADRGDSFERTVDALMRQGLSRDDALEAIANPLIDVD